VICLVFIVPIVTTGYGVEEVVVCDYMGRQKEARKPTTTTDIDSNQEKRKRDCG